MDACYFNSDFEDYLNSKQEHYKINLNSKSNQEFEYLLHFIFNEPILTLKEYDPEYVKHAESISNKDFKTTIHGSKINFFMIMNDNKELDKKLNSKITAAKYGIDNKFCHAETKVISSIQEYQNSYLCKKEFSSSGRGFSTSPNESWFRKSNEFIMEPKLDRKKDFSSLILDDDIINYENFIDEQFQYKGTYLRPINFNTSNSYIDSIKRVKDYYRSLGAGDVFSIDSFYYLENNTEKTYLLSEVNHRRSFGWIAVKLKEVFQFKNDFIIQLFSQKRLKKFKSYNDFLAVVPTGIIPMSPLGNRFMLICTSGKNEQQIHKKIDEFMHRTFV